MKILAISDAQPVGSFDAEDGIISFKVDNDDETLTQALAWVSAQETMPLTAGGETEDGLFYTEEIPVKPGDQGYFDAVSEFLYDYGYYLDLENALEAMAA